MAALLDSLPLEILLEVASWLDWRSLLSLERASARCGDAVALHLGRQRVFRVIKADLLDAELALWELLPRLTALRELRVELKRMRAPRKLMQALVFASRCWPRLELIKMNWFGLGPETYLLRKLCANCPRLTHVTLACNPDDETVAAVLAVLPGLCVLRVSGNALIHGAWLAQLPAQLRRLTFDCRRLRSAAVAQLARCGELRSLELLWGQGLQPAHLATGLAGCARLKVLRLNARGASVSDCLPPTGLHALRHLDLSFCCLTDADLRRLLERLPGLESVRLEHCSSTTPSDLALLGRLPALSALSLVGTDGVSDWLLDRLSAAPLVELHFGGSRTRDVTPEGLLRLTQSCPTLRTVMLRTNVGLLERVPCGPGVEERHLLRWLRVRMWMMTDLTMSGNVWVPHSLRS